MLGDIATLVVMLAVILFPVLIPAVGTAFHAVSDLRRPRSHARTVSDRIGHDVEPVLAAA